MNTLFAVTFLCLSNCVVPFLCNDTAWKWTVTDKDALSVRCSHYYMSQATLTAAGVGTHLADDPSTLLGPMDTKPWHGKKPCIYVVCSSHLVRLVNVIISRMTLLQLAYLGVIFSSSGANGNEDTRATSTLLQELNSDLQKFTSQL